MKLLHQTSAPSTPKVSPGQKDFLHISRASLYTGLYTRIARQLGLDPSYVRRVDLGERKSPRVTAAIAAELARLQEIHSPQPAKKRIALRCYFRAKNGDVFAQFYEVGGIRIRAKIGRASQTEVAS